MLDSKSRTAGKIINQAKQNLSKHITSIKKNGRPLTDLREIAKTLNNYFVDKIVPKDDSNKMQYNSYMSTKEKPMFLQPCLSHDIMQIIRSLKRTNSVGYDGISTKVTKYVATNISTYLSYIFNLCIVAGVYTDRLKTSIIKPIFKRDDREYLENYRTIALVSVISKIFEKHIHKEQKGFKPNKTINMAIYLFIYSFILALERLAALHQWNKLIISPGFPTMFFFTVVSDVQDKLRKYI